MRFLKSFCKIMDFWPEREEKNSKTRIFRLRYILVLQFCFTLVAGVLYLTNSVGKQTFYDLGHTIITVLMNVVSVEKITGSLTARRVGHVGFELHEKLQPHTTDA
ncbi:uncharacterized protein LOC114253429 [Bombyx mandarina]|uniref:Uncharacterized protein LOC114253429 n=1 Tax=Bombyx mandarina TaxID=7092 RepID=A0A6J2KPN5_BOMMA|nr:uncharacterized protein LOC114253429 [Bombyx mandarina]